MVTADINRERRVSSAVDGEEDEKNNRILQARLDRLYLEQTNYNRQAYSSYRSQSPVSSRDMYMQSNTVPVYRHGRKYYVSIEEYERMRAEERRQRRNQMHRAQNLPLPKSHPTAIRSISTSYYNPIHRSVSNPQDYRQGVPRSVNIIPNSGKQSEDVYRPGSSRTSRSTFKYNDDHDPSNLIPTPLPVRLPTTTTMRSNSSDKFLELRRTPQPTKTSLNDYATEEYAVRRSLSAEMVPDQILLEQRPVPIRRQVPLTSYDYNESNESVYPQNFTDPTSSPTKVSNYTNQFPPSVTDSPRKYFISDRNSLTPTFETNPQETDSIYNGRNPVNRRNESLPPAQSTTSSTSNPYFARDENILSYADDRSSSPPTFIQRRNTDSTRPRRSELIVETDNDYDIQNPVFSRATTARSQSNDRLTEKKRVRFADMEGYTLERSSDREQQQQQQIRAMDYRPYSGPTNVERSNDIRRTNQPYPTSVYPMTNRLGNLIESKLATDV